MNYTEVQLLLSKVKGDLSKLEPADREKLMAVMVDFEVLMKSLREAMGKKDTKALLELRGQVEEFKNKYPMLAGGR